jgi:hypothetical protein
MTLRRLVGVVPVIAVLALAAPVASASAQTAPGSGPGSMIPCYPYPAFCGPSGQPWFSPLAPITIPTLPAGGFHFGPGPVRLPNLPGRVTAP